MDHGEAKDYLMLLTVDQLLEGKDFASEGNANNSLNGLGP